MKRQAYTFGLIFLSTIYSVCCVSAQTVTVNVAAEKGPAERAGVGFLHSFSPFHPADDYVFPLKPTYFRMKTYPGGDTGGAFFNYPRTQRLGARVVALVSDKTGYGSRGWWPGDDGDWSNWERIVEVQVRQALKAGYDFQWDIWNEPDLVHYWNPEGTKQQRKERFFETWRRGYQIIRQLDPDGVIVGPSISRFSDPVHANFTMEEFLIYARDNEVLPDVLSWHDWRPNHLASHLEVVRNFMALNDIEIDRISINEYGGRYEQTRPGVLPLWFAVMERGGVESSARACWPETEGGQSNCWFANLCGIVTYPERKPRSAWWSYKAYADITGTLTEVTPSASVDGVAGFDEVSRWGRILLGRDAQDTVDVELRIISMDSAGYLFDASGQVRVVINKIPHSGWDELPEPITVSDSLHESVSDTLSIQLNDFGPHDAYQVKLYNPDDFCAYSPDGFSPADLDYNCIVDIEDFAVFVDNWLHSSLQ